MSFLAETLAFNREFVQNRSYAEIPQSKYPKKKVLVVTCMDARLVELLPRAMSVHNGDAKFVKTAGALISHPFGGAMRSIMVGVYQLGVEEILVIGHHDCGMIGLRPELVLERAQTRGIPPERLDTLKGAGIDLEGWLTGFDRVEEAVAHSVEMIRQHPLIPRDLPVHGLVVDPTTGQLEVLIDGYNM